MSRPWIRVVQVTVPPDRACDAVRGHRRSVDEWRRAGVLIASYEFAENDGFVDVYRARDLLEARDRADDSPLVAEGFAAWFVRPLHTPDEGG